MLFCCDRKNVFPVDAHPINKTCRKLIRILEKNGGEEGIRTLDTLLTYTHFPGVRLQPLGHLSVKAARVN